MVPLAVKVNKPAEETHKSMKSIKNEDVGDQVHGSKVYESERNVPQAVRGH